MDFKSYYEQNKKTYDYTIKVASDKFSKDSVEPVLVALKTLDLKSSTKPKSTPIQENPLDFPNIKNMPVHIFNVTVGYPTNIDTLERVVAEALGLVRQQVVAYAETDPRKQYTVDFLYRKSPEFKEDYVPALGSDHPETGDKYLHSDQHTKDVVKQSLKDAKKPIVVTNTLHPKQTIDKSTHADKGVGPQGTNSPIPGKKSDVKAKTTGIDSPIPGRKTWK